jgi:hypothetical protein
MNHKLLAQYYKDTEQPPPIYFKKYYLNGHFRLGGRRGKNLYAYWNNFMYWLHITLCT